MKSEKTASTGTNIIQIKYFSFHTFLAGSMTAVAFLKVNVPPSLTVSPEGSIQVNAGENVRLQCIGQGDPVPKVFWEKIDGYM